MDARAAEEVQVCAVAADSVQSLIRRIGRLGDALLDRLRDLGRMFHQQMLRQELLGIRRTKSVARIQDPVLRGLARVAGQHLTLDAKDFD